MNNDLPKKKLPGPLVLVRMVLVLGGSCSGGSGNHCGSASRTCTRGSSSGRSSSSSSSSSRSNNIIKILFK